MTSKARTRGPETVTVVVVANHDQLKRGETGEVELTDSVRARLDRGWLRLADGTEATAPPLGGTPAPAPGPVSLLGVTPGDDGGGAGAAGGKADGPA
jgi:hypothetical protein